MPLSCIASNTPKRMHRYYRMDVRPDLFGQWCLMREWERIGSTGVKWQIEYDWAVAH